MENFEKIILPEEGLVRLPVVLKMLGIKRTAFYEGIRRGDYPKPVRLGPRISAWPVKDLRKLIADCCEKRSE